MKIVVATSAPSFWQPQAECFAEAMRWSGHEARVATYQSIDQFYGRPADLLFCIGSWESLRPFLNAVPAPRKILYLIESVPTATEADDMTRSKLQTHREYLHEFGCVFVHTRRSLPTLQSLGLPRVEVLIWPHFPSIYRPAPIRDKDLDILFVGTPTPYRRWVLGRAASKFTIAIGKNAFHHAAAALYSRAKIVLNIHFTPLRNFECRLLESLGCGAFLLTEALDPDDILRDREHLAVFNEHNLLDMLDRYLRDAPERARIAEAGHCEVQKYCVETQVKRVLEVAHELHGHPRDREPSSNNNRQDPRSNQP